MEKLIVDRIEEGIAVLEKEDLSHIEVPLAVVGIELHEGNILLFDGEKYTLCADEEELRRKKIFEMQKKLKNKDKKS